MTRAGHLMETILRSDNLAEAFLRAARGKRDRAEVLRFAAEADAALERIRAEMAAGTYRFGAYYRFTVWDPKKRTICAAPFRDRVAMHAMMRVCHPVFEAYQVYDSYASRPGKGTYAALARAQHLARRYRWFVKLDMVKYFDSIAHDVVRRQLRSLFKDARLLALFDQLLDGYETSPGRGLPIGNLTSQYLANHYLAPADHALHERWRVRAAVRYMDDVLLFDDDKARLLSVAAAYVEEVRRTLRLDVHEPVLNACCAGIPFLGYVVHPQRLHLNQRSRRRFRRGMAALSEAMEAGRIGEEACRQRAAAMLSFVSHADCRPFVRAVGLQQGPLP